MREPIQNRWRRSLAGCVLAAAVAPVGPAAAGPAPAAPSGRETGDAATTVDEGSLAATTAGVRRHRRRQRRPVKMGTSLGNVENFTVDGEFIYCCSGTGGALIEKRGVQYILSNNHVTGLLNAGRPGDPISQPGSIDSDCEDDPDDYIALHSGQRRLRFRGNNRVDAALSEVIEGRVDSSGRVIGIGIPGSTPVPAELGMRVKKSGRTSGVRLGEIVAVDVSVLVGYETECGSGVFRDARFVGQIIAESVNRPFTLGGDSGAMAFEDRRGCPRPVGLIYAGSATGAGVMSGMDTVLRQVSKIRPRGPASVVGCEAEASDAASASTVAASEHVHRGPRVWSEAELGRARRIRRRHEDGLFGRPGVHAVGVGAGGREGEELVLKVWVDGAGSVDAIPESLGGVPTEVIVAERFEALGNCSRRRR